MIEEAVDLSHCQICDTIENTKLRRMITDVVLCDKCAKEHINDNSLENLRKKLIEDITSGAYWWVGEPYEITQRFEECRDYIIENIINKHFGVKE